MGFLALIQLVQLFFYVLYLVVLAGVILSWVELGLRNAPWLYSPPINFIRELSFQIIRPFRNLLERLGLRTGPIDFSPVIAMVAINIVQKLVVSLLWSIGGAR
jgi:YggT family protein